MEDRNGTQSIGPWSDHSTMGHFCFKNYILHFVDNLGGICLSFSHSILVLFLSFFFCGKTKRWCTWRKMIIFRHVQYSRKKIKKFERWMMQKRRVSCAFCHVITWKLEIFSRRKQSKKEVKVASCAVFALFNVCQTTKIALFQHFHNFCINWQCFCMFQIEMYNE